MDFLIYLICFILSGSSSSSNIAEGLGAENIVGGIRARSNEFKYTVAVMYKEPGSQDVNPCVGSIIGNFHIATVAHCFYDRPTANLIHKEFYIAISVKDLDTVAYPPARHIRVRKVTMPRTWDPTKMDTYDQPGNLAIVQLSVALGWRHRHPFLGKLISRYFPLINYPGNFYVSGFGYHENSLEPNDDPDSWLRYKRKGWTDGKLRYSKAEILSKSECLDIFSEPVAPGNMCARLIRTDPENPIGICKGDSGAPIVHKNFLDGIAITYFLPCDEEMLPGIYIDVYYYQEFIEEILIGNITDNMYILELVEKSPAEFMFEQIFPLQSQEDKCQGNLKCINNNMVTL